MLTTFKQHLLADKKKSALLAVLFGTLLIVLGSLLVSDSTPDIAEAGPNAAPPTAVKPPVRPMPRRPARTTRPQPGDDPAAGSRRWTARPQAPRRAITVAKMPRGLQRDLFNTTAWARFSPVVGSLFGGRGDGEDQPGLWDAMAKAVIASQKSRRQQLSRLAEELAQLELQSTMTGSAPLAYISGRLVHQGDTIRGFSVVRIDDRRVTLRKDGVNHELAMP
jgi:hypothetical protein